MLKIKGKNSKDTVFFEVNECTGKPALYSDLCLVAGRRQSYASSL